MTANNAPIDSVASKRMEWVDGLLLTAVLGLLTLIPFHYLILYAFVDVPVAKYWKEAYLVLILIAHYATQIERGGFSVRSVFGHGLVALFAGTVLFRVIVGATLRENRYLAIYGAYNLLFFSSLAGVSYNLLRSQASADKFLSRLARCMAIVGVLAVVDWVFELSRSLEVLNERSLIVSTYVGTSYRAYLGCDSPMELGMYLGVGLILSLYFVVKPSPSGRVNADGSGSRILAGLGGVACFAGMLVTLSRGPLVAVAVAGVVIVLFVNGGLSGRNIVSAPLKALLAIPIVLTAAMLSGGAVSTEWRTHLASIFDWSSDPGNMIRLIRWAEGLSRFAEAPWIGHGIGTASTRLQKYREETLGQAYFQTESVLISFGVEGGLLLVAAFLIMALGIVIGLGRMASEHPSPNRRSIATLLLATLVALGIEMVINPMLDFRSFTLLTWTLIGLSLRLVFPPTKGSLPLQRQQTTQRVRG